ncbi:unnamed protein product [Rotaria sordida]|uniref:Uncharacterized protein n=1 Tax=Rotaria sordida TaxID=392033 RepID=A0A819RCN3_9BILA|nr:unnamed protein product [Rotaria sordida]CAF4038552.1 unnamed protein product [Rotaria sordida]
MTAGIGKLASIGSTAAKIGSVSKTAMFIKIMKGVAGQFAHTCLTNIITNKVMEQIQSNAIPKIINLVEENLLTGIFKSISTKVENLYTISTNEAEFEKSFSHIKVHMQGALGKNMLLPQQFNNIRVQVASALDNVYDTFADGLRNSSSKYAKMAGTTIKAVSMVNKIMCAVESVLKFTSTIKTFNNLIEGVFNIKNDNANVQNRNEKIITDRVEQLKNIIKGYIAQKLTRELDRILRQLISGVLKKIGEAIAQITKATVDSLFNKKNLFDKSKTFNQSNDSGQSQVSVEQPSSDVGSQKEKENAAKREDLQNNIKNPKAQRETYEEEAKDKSRGMNLADIMMLANKKKRNIVVYDSKTGTQKVIRPEGVGKIFAFFKTNAKIKHIPDENGGIGHFITGRGNENYIQKNGRKNCLLIAYHESLGRNVDDSFIEKEQKEIYQYTTQHLDKYLRYRANIDSSGQNLMIGGEKIEKPSLCEKDKSPISEDRRGGRWRTSRPHERQSREESLKSQRQRTTSGNIGTYGARKVERTRLQTKYDTEITGKGYESDHAIPYFCLAVGAKLERNTSHGRELENNSPACYVSKDAHRQHISTGSSKKSREFRNHVRVALIEGESASIPIQLIQLEYAYTNSFIKNRKTQSRRISDDSYYNMIMSLRRNPIPYYDDSGSPREIYLSDQDIKECILARWTVVHGKRPTDKQGKKIIRKVFKKYDDRS